MKSQVQPVWLSFVVGRVCTGHAAVVVSVLAGPDVVFRGPVTVYMTVATTDDA